MREVVYFFSLEKHVSAGLVSRKAQDRAAGRRLAAAGLADQAHRCAALEAKRHAVNCLDLPDDAVHHAAADREVLLQVPDHQDIFAVPLKGLF